MNIFFIEESEKINFLKQIFKPIQCIDEKIILNCKINKLNIKKKLKLANKIKAILETEKTNTIITCKKIKEDEKFINILYSRNINIIDGRNLFKRLAIDIVECILEKNKMNIKDLKIAIMTNNDNQLIETIIKNLSTRCKNFQIITNCINRFERLESILYQEVIIINVTNNKRKSLRETEIILNMDFPNETINQYNIYEKAIIVSFEEPIKIRKKRFSGSVINWYKAGIKNNENILCLIKDKDFDKYNSNELIECFYLLDKIKAEDIYVDSLS